MEKSKGITLIALIITIILLIILAGITISIAIQSGIIGQAKRTIEGYADEEIREQIQLAVAGSYNSDGIIDLKKLEENLRLINVLNEEEVNTAIEELETFKETIIRGIKITIGKDGKVTIANGGSNIVTAGEYTGDSHKKYEETYEDGTKAVAYIPAGFTVSNIEGETSISDGLVIYSGEVTNWATAKRTNNQYVWIPVDDPNEIYGTITEEDVALNSGQDLVVGQKYGKLYFKDQFDKDSHYNWPSEENYTKLSGHEPDLLNNHDTSEYYYKDILGFQTQEEYRKAILDEFDRMIESITKYHGFYIGRYELTGEDNNPSIIQNAKPLASINWYKFYNNCKKIEDTNAIAKDKVSTSIIWGCQWDQALKKAVVATTNPNTGKNCLTDRLTYGWYKSNSNYSLYKNTGTKAATYNIYDMGGNMNDWTMEGDDTPNTSPYAVGNYADRTFRGSNLAVSSASGTDNSAAGSRSGSYGPYASDSRYGVRAQLYLQ